MDKIDKQAIESMIAYLDKHLATKNEITRAKASQILEEYANELLLNCQSVDILKKGLQAKK